MGEYNIKLVPMQLAQVDECANIMSSLEFFRTYDVTYEKANVLLTNTLKEKDADLTVALHGEVVIGFTWFVIRGAFDRSGYLRLIAVSQSYNRQGVGRLLIERLEKEYLQQNGIFLLTTDNNYDAHRFYEKLNYHQVGLIPNYVLHGLNERIYFKAMQRSKQ